MNTKTTTAADGVGYKDSSAESREAFFARIEAMPAWRRRFTCWFLRRKHWKVARAYNVVATHECNVRGNYDLYDELRKRGEDEWRKVYPMPNKQVSRGAQITQDPKYP